MKAHTASVSISKFSHKWLSTVLSCSDTDIVLSKIIRDIKTMDSLYHKSKNSKTVFYRCTSDKFER